MPILTQEARRKIIADTVAAVSKDAERRPVKWRGATELWPVVKLRVADVLLNVNSHRIRAQINSMEAEGQKILEDPFGEESQEAIKNIIRNTRGYPNIKATIARDLQEHPGVITHEGILINANTRAVALADLCAERSGSAAEPYKYLKVHVLPQDATEPEIAKLELEFQMSPEIRQEYTFTNRLLFIRDLLDSGQTPEQIGLEMERSYDPANAKDRATAAKQIEAEDRMRVIIQELIALSDGALTWQHFDDERQNLIDVDQAYQSMIAKRGDEAARRVKQAKLVGVLAGLDYRRVRLIDETFLDDYVIPALEEEPPLKDSARALAIGTTTEGIAHTEGLDVLDGLDELGPDPAFGHQGNSAGTPSVTLDVLFSLLLGNGDDDALESLDVPTDNGNIQLTKGAFRASVKSALTSAATTKEREGQGQNALDAPRKHITSAGNACDKATRALQDLAQRSEQVDVEALRNVYQAYLRSHDELLEQLRSSDYLGCEADAETTTP